MKSVFLLLTCLLFALVAVGDCEKLHNLAHYELVQVEDVSTTRRETGKKYEKLLVYHSVLILVIMTRPGLSYPYI